MKKLRLLATGGTIASTPGAAGLAPSLDGRFLKDAISDSQHACTIESRDLFSIDSTNMQPEHWLTIAKAILEDYDHFDGFVITHGTDTMAYTAAALCYLLASLDKPIIITGSQVPLQNQKTDARQNLMDAVRMALEPFGGVFVVFNGKVIAGTRAMKIRTKSFDAFESINFPYIGLIENGKITYHVSLSPLVSSPFPRSLSLCPDVALLRLYPGINPLLLDAIAPLCKGLVIESFGNGGIPSLERNLLPKIEQLIEQGVIVVITTQCLQEGEDISLYEVGRKVAENRRIIISKDMNTEAIIPKLMWALGQTRDPLLIHSIMETPIFYDCT
nr:asparaginase [Bacilli bacterium]